MAEQRELQPLTRWRARYGFRVQAACLLTIVVGSFVLYAALQAGVGALAALCFAAIALATAVVMWIT